MNGPEGFLPKNQNFMTQVARIPWYRPVSYSYRVHVKSKHFPNNLKNSRKFIDSSTLDSTVYPRLLFLFPLCFVGSDKPLTIVSNFQKSFWLIFNITWNKHFLFWQKRWCCKVIAVWKNLLFIMKVPTFTFGEVFWKCLNLNLSPPLLRSVEPIYNSRPGTWLIIHNFVPHFDSHLWISI